MSRAWLRVLAAVLAVASVEVASDDAHANGSSGYSLVNRYNQSVSLSADGRHLHTIVPHALDHRRQFDGASQPVPLHLITPTVGRRDMRRLRAAARHQLRLERQGLSMRDYGLTHGDAARVRQGEALLHRASAELSSTPVPAGGTSMVADAGIAIHFDVLGHNRGAATPRETAVSVAFAREPGTSKLLPRSVTITHPGVQPDGSNPYELKFPLAHH